MDSNTILLKDKIKVGDAFFFAGSGISYESFLPSAGKLLHKTAELFFPHGSEFTSINKKIIKDENNCSIQPEIFYENLLYLTKSLESLHLWNIFSETYLERFNLSLTPNINHLFIVEYSVKNRVPIFTTNFDNLFELASKELGYKFEVILPYLEKQKVAINSFKNNQIVEKTAYIFKLHGTIDSIETLHTTMISISRVNFDLIEFIYNLCKGKHIVFVGYSGRDIDYFPEIKKRNLNCSPFWISKFDKKDVTYINSEKINAIRVSGNYPSRLFELINKNPKIKAKKIEINLEVIEKIFSSLQNDIKKNVPFTNEDKILFLGLLCKEMGEYENSYEILRNVFHNDFSSFDVEKKVLLLITLSKLAHEISQYKSSEKFAKEALKLTEKEKNLNNYSIICWCQICEAKRMLIAHDISFWHNVNYLDSFLAVISFVISYINSSIRITLKNKQINYSMYTNSSVTEIIVANELIEHRIRFFALIQALSKPLLDINGLFSPLIKELLIRKWEVIQEESYYKGYSQGIANSLKYKTRIAKDLCLQGEAEHIYELTTSYSGIALSMRNIAEYYFEKKEFEKSKEYYCKVYKYGEKSGNRLNSIKGMLGVAKCNEALGIKPLLNTQEIVRLKELMNKVEGESWRKYFKNVLSEIEIIKN